MLTRTSLLLLGFVLACGSSTPAANTADTTNTTTAPSASAAPSASTATTTASSSSAASPGISLCGGLTTEYLDKLNAGGACATAAAKTSQKLDEIKAQMSKYDCEPPPGTLGACSQARKKLECKAGHCG